ncbi:MAG: GNAT family N-acetyltransferase [Phycisphaerae bacterium]|nr:MAG: GNAT family N-acetyltransferase [Planctomycetota bacterium]KAB2940245.1 MAG: GNAT family N-acetyltransferase [Phycisphaerae bacterium]MBE7458265.1 GNAT family N-acetyltransferase [Planctomycetia bacterium]MCK6466098.1 GNAT family N-acetyltransferase [Phycisphaerae bacterium]MCL4718699.1 GNAT family N-acetyltransferase [Phycisphaerae bacterium]
MTEGAPRVSSLEIRPATVADVPLIVALIRELAEYERLSHACAATEDALRRHLFGARPFAEALVAEVEGRGVGFALFFHTFSTFEAAPTLYLEDLYVRPEERRRGVGKALLTRLAKLAVERGCRRFEWSVLEWNRPAIDFYVGLGARLLDDWRICRVDGAALTALATGAQRAT